MFKMLIASIILVSPFFNNVEAIQLKTEFYRQEDLPKRFRALCPVEGSYCTIIFIEGWPSGRTISITETDCLISQNAWAFLLFWPL